MHWAQLKALGKGNMARQAGFARAATSQAMSQAQTSGEHVALLEQAAKSTQDHAGDLH